MEDWCQHNQNFWEFSKPIKQHPSPEFWMQIYITSSAKFNPKDSFRVPFTQTQRTHTHSGWPTSPTSSLGHVRSGSMLEEHGSNGLWEFVESPMRALQTACCRASPPTYDCSPAVAVATAALDGRLLYFLSVWVYVRAQACVFISILKAKLLTADLDPLNQEVHSVTPHSKELKTVLKISLILFSCFFF